MVQYKHVAGEPSDGLGATTKILMLVK